MLRRRVGRERKGRWWLLGGRRAERRRRVRKGRAGEGAIVLWLVGDL